MSIFRKKWSAAEYRKIELAGLLAKVAFIESAVEKKTEVRGVYDLPEDIERIAQIREEMAIMGETL